MTRTLATALGVALTISVASAQPTPAPAGAPMKTAEKAGIQLGSDARLPDAVSADDERLAIADFRQANDHLDNGLFLQAVDKYNAALAHWDHPAIHYNLALALINLDRPLEVYEQLIKAIAYGPDPIEQDKYDHAKEYLRLVEGQLADIELSCDEPGARVAVDGKDVFIAPGKYTAKVVAGKHTFVADKPGYNARIVAPFVGPGESFRIELTLYTAQQLTRYRRRWDQAWLPYSVIGAGALFGLVGGGLELSARSSFQDYDATVDECNTASNGACRVTPGLQALRDRGQAQRTAGLVMYGVAGGAIAIGAALAYLNRREEYHIRAEDLDPPQVSVTPIAAPGLAGALLQGQF